MSFWLESHQSLGRHPKLIRLAGELRIHRAQAVGHLHYLWWWALDFAPKGDLSVFAPAEISAGAEWPGEPGLFHKAIYECGWVDPDGMIHNWMDYAGNLIATREKDRERKRVQRNSIGHPSDVHRKSGVPNPTEPNKPTKPDNPLSPKGEEKKSGGEDGLYEIEIPELIRTPDFKRAWADWLEYRRERKPRVTPIAARRQLAKMEKLGETKALAAIENSISNSYQGIFEERNANGKSSRATRTAEDRGQYAEPKQFEVPILNRSS